MCGWTHAVATKLHGIMVWWTLKMICGWVGFSWMYGWMDGLMDTLSGKMGNFLDAWIGWLNK